jgi:CMP-2-keto-3-deoxyoctulosonic acid synthetase
VHVSSTRIATERLDWIAGDPMVNTNVWTARKSSPDNLINCDMIDGKLAAITPAPAHRIAP